MVSFPCGDIFIQSSLKVMAQRVALLITTPFKHLSARIYTVFEHFTGYWKIQDYKQVNT